MLILSFRESNSERIIAESLNILKNGGVIAYPTESFYALGVLATDEIAVRKLFELKKRPAEKPLPIYCKKRSRPGRKSNGKILARPFNYHI
jgi:L-threonylcarbamoyladenylate synthase